MLTGLKLSATPRNTFNEQATALDAAWRRLGARIATNTGDKPTSCCEGRTLARRTTHRPAGLKCSVSH